MNLILAVLSPPTVTHAPSPPFPWGIALLVAIGLALVMALVGFAAWFVWRGLRTSPAVREAGSLKGALQPRRARPKAV
jgi:hypothetical protein